MSEHLKTRTVIIGAGVSGLAAANNLLNNGYTDFVVIEALDRIGGRIFTTKQDGDLIIEYGAQYIHGQVDNPIFDLARDNKLIDASDVEIAQEDELQSVGIHRSSFYYALNDGRRASYSLVDRASNCFDNAILKAKAIAHQLDRDISLGQFLFDTYYQMIDEEFSAEYAADPEDKKQLRLLVNGLFNWRCKCECIISGAASIYHSSTKYHETFQDLGGALLVQPTLGYQSVLDSLIAKNRVELHARLRLRHALKRILMCRKLLNSVDAHACEHCKYSSDERQLVLLVDDLAKGKKSEELVVLCDQVLSTMSLGYLKAHMRHGLVEPVDCVPSEKLAAIDRLGFGTVNKIMLVYEKPFWSKECDSFWLMRKLKLDEQFVNNLRNPEEREAADWLDYLDDFDVDDRFGNVLIGWVNQNDAYESLDDTSVADACTRIFRTFMARGDIPPPVRIFRSKWGTDAYTRGSYTYTAYGSLPSDFARIAEPVSINNKMFLLFAGEHTHDRYFSTVHGAYMTGLRESERILQNRDQ